MSLKEIMHNNLQKEKKKLKEMTFKKKCEYIWEYYKVHIIVTLIFILFSSSLGYSIYQNVKYDDILTSAIINNSMSDENRNYISNGFAEYYELDKESETLLFDDTFHIDLDTPNESTYASTQKFAAMVAAKSMDTTIADISFFENYADEGTFYDLSTLLPEDLYAELENYLYYTKDEEGKEKPFGLNLSSSHLVKGAGLYINPPILSVVINSKHPDVAIEFIKYAFNIPN